mmetsp:Transcript_11210/g.12841  ORF Transcript_11210/g.12841 Transcript_11210/m.12841 type:complete len:250 (-) Transcript_11210:73-822(-)
MVSFRYVVLLFLRCFNIPLLLAFSPEFRGASRMFLDTADTKEWDELLPLGIFHGVTTNPTLLERAGEKCSIENLHRMSEKALRMTDEFMCQTWGTSTDEMYDRGMSLSEPDRGRIVIKVPVTYDGVKVAAMLVRSGCRVCLTACYHRKQALIAANVGAEYIAPYLGRMTDAGKDGITECLKMQKIVTSLGSGTRILVASIRDADTMVNLAEAGEMETFTFAPAVARDLFLEDLTQEAAVAFEESAKQNS